MRKLLLSLSIALAINPGFAAPASAVASFVDGNELYEKCRKGDMKGAIAAAEWGQCFGYIKGVVDMLSSMEDGFDSCLPSGVKAGK